MEAPNPLRELQESLPQVGRVEWLGIRPAREEPMVALESVLVERGNGLKGDRFKGRPGSSRQVTLLQHEHLRVIGALLHRGPVSPALLRRNIVVSGINLLGLKDRRFRLGEVVLEFTGLCRPCSKMERQLGEGGYNAMRGHGGITARVLEAGEIRVGDEVMPIPA